MPQPPLPPTRPASQSVYASARTGDSVSGPLAVPLPNWLSLLTPQHHRVPPRVTPHAVVVPTETRAHRSSAPAWTGVGLPPDDPSPSSPRPTPSAPQHQSVPA